MKFKEILNEGKDSPLYHGTRPKNLVKIISDDKLIGNTAHRIGEKTYFGVSLSRDYNTALNVEKDQTYNVVFVLDQKKLTQNYKLKPVDYFQTDTVKQNFGNNVTDEFMKNYTRKSGVYAEAEEFLIGNIQPLSKYLISVNLPPGDVYIYDDIPGFSETIDELDSKGILNKSYPISYRNLYDE